MEKYNHDLNNICEACCVDRDKLNKVVSIAIKKAPPVSGVAEYLEGHLTKRELCTALTLFLTNNFGVAVPEKEHPEIA